MQKIVWNDGWAWRRLNEGDWKAVTLPHDAMIGEPRGYENAGGTNSGWYEGHDYEYVKTFTAPAAWKDKEVTLEFEGVYRNAEVYVNGEKACYRAYGYTNFYVPLDKFLRYGAENEVRVVAENSKQPNSRWYSGAGIYRPVDLFIADKQHVLMNGVRIRTLSLDPAVVEIEVKTTGAGAVSVCIEKEGKAFAEGARTATASIPSA